jgi:hypothetical protein
MAVPHSAMRAVRGQLYRSFSGDMIPSRYSKNCASVSPPPQSKPEVAALVRIG